MRLLYLTAVPVIIAFTVLIAVGLLAATFLQRLKQPVNYLPDAAGTGFTTSEGN